MTHISLIFGRILCGRSQLCAMGIASVLYAPSIFAQNNEPVAPTDAAPAAISVQKRYPAGTIQSMEAADRALADVEMERAAIEAQFATEQHACFAEFFANACVDEAKERRRVSLATIRPVEIEANMFKRRMRVIERDKALAEKRAEDERNRLQRVQHERANLADSDKASDAAVKKPAPEGANQKNTAPTIDDRVRQHEERLRRLEAEDRANAQKRAENIADYEEKVRKAQERQRRVEEKKKQKELKKANQSMPAKQ